MARYQRNERIICPYASGLSDTMAFLVTARIFARANINKVLRSYSRGDNKMA